MAERWVINASPLILLAKAELVQLLPSLCEELVIPKGVAVEIDAGRTADAACAWLKGDGAPFVRAGIPLHSALAKWHGGAGEAEVISFALQNPVFIAALDDRRARSFAIEHGVRVLGSLRITPSGVFRSAMSANHPSSASSSTKNSAVTSSAPARIHQPHRRSGSLTPIVLCRHIVIAKEKGLISRAKPALEKLRGVGAYVSNGLIDRAIELAGE